MASIRTQHFPNKDQRLPAEFRRGARDPRVVVGFDASAASERALVYANGVARRLGARLVIVHVDQIPVIVSAFASLGSYPLDPSVGYPLDAGHGLPEASGKQAAPALDRRIDDVLGSDATPWTLVRLTGRLDQELSAIAGNLQADVIVVGKQRRRMRHILGSRASRLSRHYQQPIVTVP